MSVMPSGSDPRIWLRNAMLPAAARQSLRAQHLRIVKAIFYANVLPPTESSGFTLTTGFGPCRGYQ
jgi:hypothetical protein